MTVIRESYRVLMQKLETYPHLDNPDWNVSLLNTAFNTLRDPHKRAAYDRELLKRYHIKALSQGAPGVNANTGAGKQSNERAVHLNQRNYYRILQVQPDAPTATIMASYQALKKSLLQDTVLLDEAYRILANPTARKRYDTLLAGNLMRAAKKTARADTHLPVIAERVKNPSLSSVAESYHYQAVITHYCSFCKTPYVPQTGLYHSGNCLECASPLLILQQENLQSPRRTLMRINVQGEFAFYLFWPSPPCQGIFQDLSPVGIRFLTDVMLDPADIIKIDAPNFQAVAEVTHRHHERSGISVGTRFIAVKFDRRHGNFVTLRV